MKSARYDNQSQRGSGMTPRKSLNIIANFKNNTLIGS